MTNLILILISTVLVNNFVLVRFLGLCPFMGVSRNLEAAFGMSLATAFVLSVVQGQCSRAQQAAERKDYVIRNT